MKAFKWLGAIALIGAMSTLSSVLWAKDRITGRGTGPVVYVTSQNLFYDSIVLADLPFNNTDNFQKLEPGVGPSGLQTESGPGDQGYYGGRWWIDVNGNDYMDIEDKFFLCPLLGPGRADI